MAASYSILSQGITWATNKNMLAISNHTGSGVIVDVYRIWLINLRTATVTGGLCLVDLWQCSSVASFTGGAAQTFVKHDTSSAAVPAQVLANAGTSTVLTKNSLLRRVIRPNDEFGVGEATIDALAGFFLPLNCIWNSGYGDSNIQPIRLRTGEGIVLYTQTTGSGTMAGETDIIVEMTIY